jgi:hypothetical protein
MNVKLTLVVRGYAFSFFVSPFCEQTSVLQSSRMFIRKILSLHLYGNLPISSVVSQCSVFLLAKLLRCKVPTIKVTGQSSYPLGLYGSKFLRYNILRAA